MIAKTVIAPSKPKPVEKVPAKEVKSPKTVPKPAEPSRAADPSASESNFLTDAATGKPKSPPGSPPPSIK